MKHFIEYFYSIEVNNLRTLNIGYFFDSYDKKYILYKIKKEKQIIKMQNNYSKYKNNPLLHSIILNIYKKPFSFDGKDYWALLLVNIGFNKKIDFDDILKFSKNYLLGYNIKPLKWIDLWKNKVDYIESYLNSNDSIDSKKKILCIYYLGIAENAIQYLKQIFNTENGPVLFSLSHERIQKSFLLFDLYNPFNLIEDHISRDISEYIKSFFIEIDYNNICKKISGLGLNNIDFSLIISRILFPSMFFDDLDLNIDGYKSDKDILNYYDYTVKYEKFISSVLKNAKKNRNIYVPTITWIINNN